MNEEQVLVNKIRFAIIADGITEFQGHILPTPQQHGTYMQRNTYAQGEAQKFYNQHLKEQK